MLKPIVRFGNKNFATQLLNEERTAYVGTLKTYEDTLVDIRITPSQDIAETAASDNPAALQTKGMATVEVQVNLLGIKTEDLAELTGAKATPSGVFFGSSNAPVVNFGLRVDAEVNNGSTDRILVYNLTLTNPPINLTTNTREQKGRENVQLTMRGNIVIVPLANDETDNLTHAVINSVKNASAFNANATAIVFPTAEYLTAS